MSEQPDTDDLIAIRARVWEVCARTGIADEQLAEVIGADPGRIAASFACERRFSTYELAAIAEHGGTSVEWLCGEDDEPPPGMQAGLARLLAGPDVFTDDEPADQPAPRRPTGYTIGVYLPPEATDADEDAIMSLVADAVYSYKRQGWDPFVLGHAGDLLYVEHHPDAVMDFAAHVRKTWVE